MNTYIEKIHFCFCRIFGDDELSEKNKSQKNVFQSRKRKNTKKFTEVYLFTVIDHEFFLILLSNRGFCRKYFPIIEFSLCYLNRRKRCRAQWEKNFFPGVSWIFPVYECSRKPISKREPEKKKKYWEIREIVCSQKR